MLVEEEVQVHCGVEAAKCLLIVGGSVCGTEFFLGFFKAHISQFPFFVDVVQTLDLSYEVWVKWGVTLGSEL